MSVHGKLCARTALTDSLRSQLKNHYGFMGEIISQSSAEMGSSVYVLVSLFLAIYAILFVFGPPAAVPFLSEFLVAVLPLQSSLRGIVAMAADMKRKPGDKYTEGGQSLPGECGCEVLTEVKNRKCPAVVAVLGRLSTTGVRAT
jgi:hypothetical protein